MKRDGGGGIEAVAWLFSKPIPHEKRRRGAFFHLLRNHPQRSNRLSSLWQNATQLKTLVLHPGALDHLDIQPRKPQPPGSSFPVVTVRPGAAVYALEGGCHMPQNVNLESIRSGGSDQFGPGQPGGTRVTCTCARKARSVAGYDQNDWLLSLLTFGHRHADRHRDVGRRCLLYTSPSPRD